MLQAMVAGLFGCLLLLVGTCSAWHDSHHGERRAFSEPLPFHHPHIGLPLQTSLLNGRTTWTASRQSSATQGPSWEDFICSTKVLIFHPGRNLVSSSLLSLPGKNNSHWTRDIRNITGWIVIDLFQTRDDVFQGETGFPTIWTPSSWRQLRSKTGGCKRGGERGWNIILKLKCFGFTFHWWNIAGSDTGETTGGSARWIKPGRWWEFYLTEDVPSSKSFDCLFSVIQQGVL